MFFEPKLAHNRATFARVSRWRWMLAGAMMAIVISGGLLAPVQYIETLLLPTFVVFSVLVLAIEVKLFLVFRKDLSERRSSQ
jgi:predicted tellurium resistance membrane protein TerC